MVLSTGIAVAQDAVPWARSLEEAQQIAAQRQQLVLVHFYGDNCPPCKALDANVFPRPEFARGLTANYVPVKINASQNRALAVKYGVNSWPTDVILTAEGTPVVKPFNSPADPVRYLGALDQVAAAHRARMNPEVPVAYNQPTSSQPANSAANVSPAIQSNPYSNPRIASAPTQQPQGQQGVQPQQNLYDPNGYKSQAAPNAPDRRSTFQPAGVGQAYVGGAPYSEPRSDLPPRGAQHDPRAAAQNVHPQMPVADNARGLQSQASDSIYGNHGEGPVQAQRDPRSEQAQFAPQQRPDYAPQQPPMNAPRPQIQGNPMIANSPAAAPQQDPRVQVNTPAGNPPTGLDGFCPVTLTESTKWTKGDTRFGAIHRGRTYLFATQVEQQKFMANPDKYSPMLSGFDPVKYIEQGVLVDGKRQHGIVHEGQMYLFSDEAALDKFCKSPNNFTNPVRQAMQQSVAPRNFR